MQTCKKCGKEVSFWQRDLIGGTGLCPTCRIPVIPASPPQSPAETPATKESHQASSTNKTEAEETSTARQLGMIFLAALIGISGFCLFYSFFLSGGAFRLENGFKRAPVQIVIGIAGLAIAAIWIYADNRGHVATDEEKRERLMLDIAKRIRKTGVSIDTIVQEYSAKGATQETLELIRTTPSRLAAQGAQKFALGIALLVGGGGLTLGSHLLFAGQFVLFFYGAIGVGLAFTIQGARMKIAAAAMGIPQQGGDSKATRDEDAKI